MQKISVAIRGIVMSALTLALSSIVVAQTTGTSTLSVTVPTEARIIVSTSNTTLTSASTFSAFTGTTNFTYSIRTSGTTGSGTIQLQITSDFSPAGGPSVASPPTVGDALTYTCTASAGTACSGAQTASTTSQTPVTTIGADAHIS